MEGFERNSGGRHVCLPFRPAWRSPNALSTGHLVTFTDPGRFCASAREVWGDNENSWLHKTCVGSSIILNGPKPRVKSAALQARLALLQKQLEQQQYDAMVQDITRAVSTT